MVVTVLMMMSFYICACGMDASDVVGVNIVSLYCGAPLSSHLRVFRKPAIVFSRFGGAAAAPSSLARAYTLSRVPEPALTKCIHLVGHTSLYIFTETS